MSARTEKIKKHFRDNKEIYIGSAIGAVAGVVIGLVIAKKINAANGRPMSLAEIIAYENTTAEEVKKNDAIIAAYALELLALEDAEKNAV